MRKQRPNAWLGHRARDVRCSDMEGYDRAGPRASFQRAGAAGQLRRDPLRRVSRQIAFKEGLTDVFVAGLRVIAEARRSRIGQHRETGPLAAIGRR